MRRETMLAGLSVLALAATPEAQILVSVGDTVIGVGAIESFNPAFVGLTDAGMWTLVADTDYPDNTRDVVLLRNGFVTLREGASLVTPPGATLSAFQSIDLADDGDLGMVLTTRLEGANVPGAYWNLIRVADLDTPIAAPGLGAGTRWTKLEVVKLNSRGTLLVLGEIDNTSVAGTKEDALIRYELDPVGNVLSTTVLVTKGQFNDALGTTVNGLAISSTEHGLALNERGDFITYVGGVGHEAVMINAEEIVAAELAPSSVGVNWRALDQTKVALNDFGEYVLSGSLEGTGDTYLVEKNGAKFVRSGDVVDGYSTSPIVGGKSAPLAITNSGHVFWRAETQEGEAAYLRDHRPVVVAGATVLAGKLVLTLPASEHAFRVSPDGRFLLGRIDDLQGVGQSSVLVDFGSIVPVPGCFGNAGELSVTEGEARLGETFQLALDGGQAPGVLPIVSFSSRASVPGSDCGVLLGAGELLISPPHRLANLVLAPWNGSTPSAVNVRIPSDPALVDLRLHAQGFFRDLAGSSAEPTRMTNGLRIEIGAP